MPDELREKIITVFVKRGHKGKEIVEEVKEILSLIDEERCVWTLISNEMGSDFYRTSCGEASFVLNKYCRYCGKRIEVKEVKDGR